MERHCTTIAASLQARHGSLQRVAAGVPASIARLHGSFDNHQARNVVGFRSPFDSIRPLMIVGRRKQANEAPMQSNKATKPSNKAAKQSNKPAMQSNKTAMQSNEGPSQANKAAKQSNEAPNPTTIRLRKPSGLRRNRSRHPASREIRTSTCSKLSERTRHCTRMQIRCGEARVQCPVDRAQCCPTKHPDGYREVPF